MQSAKRVILVPPEQTGGSIEFPESGSYSAEINRPEKSDKIKDKIYGKIHRFIKVILKLAKSDSYDENLRIKLPSGEYLQKSNLVDLLTHAMSAGKVLHGEEEFISLLARCNVDPDLILNENMRLKIIQAKNKQSHSNQEITQRTLMRETSEDHQTLDNLENRPNLKRKNIQNDDSEKISNKRKRTEPEDDSVDDDMIDEERWKI